MFVVAIYEPWIGTCGFACLNHASFRSLTFPSLLVGASCLVLSSVYTNLLALQGFVVSIVVSTSIDQTTVYFVVFLVG